ncbi:MAG: lipoate--protein ligase family protein [Candidatus Omnitrophica bacterium]|nr:lipoate--protein ligase family protein [Candidatus Omnitrophota bacterium]MDE2232273.1 lipoate--protein ligase family protein [Candidatus Omnitrophota bacterium]
MQLRDISFPTPQENIAFDEALLRLAEKEGSGEYLRFWESSRVFIVLGRTGSAEADIHLFQTKKDHIPVLRRFSGGGTVVQGPGCLNYTLVLSKDKRPELNDLRRSYQWIAGQVIEALQRAGKEAYFRPLSDLAFGPAEKKFSGNAQRRLKKYILHHGTILYNFDLALIHRYLRHPQDIPEYRRGRSHEDFVTNVPVDPGVFKNHLSQVFQAAMPADPSTQEFSLMKQLYEIQES